VGGRRSGKSAVAERLVAAAGEGAVYVATADPTGDPELAARVARHRERRGPGWRTVETADPGSVLAACGRAPVLVDSLGAWVARLMEAEGMFGSAPRPGAAGRVGDAVASFAEAAARRAGLTVVVAEQAGWGLLPGGPGDAATRRWLDLLGEASQALAARAGLVRLVVAGRELDLPAGSEAPLPAYDPAAGRVDTRGTGTGTGAGIGSEGAPGAGSLRLHGDTMVPEGALDFAVNVVPGPPPPWLASALEASLGVIGRYPDEGRAVRALADRHGCSPGEVLPLNGSAEAFWLLGTVLQPGVAACVHPSFTEGEAALRAAGCRVARVWRDPDTFALDPATVPDAAGLVLTCNPNNPTGGLDPRAVLERLGRPGRVVVVDEAFMELCGRQDESLLPAPPPGTIVVRSLTKTWGIPGVRAGYLVGPADVVAALRAVRQPWAVSAPALAVLEACAVRRDAAAGVAAATGRRRRALAAGLAGLGVRVWPAEANFLLLEVHDGPAVRAALLGEGIAVRRCDTFPGLGPDHLRVAVRDERDNERLVAALARAIPMPAPAGRGTA
jgi:histidinol-phosphate/aromatic aminotransferase/cobyric acid decarboxylase-like protein/adenosyl cobinamide kinase/adenosyl cobinamide phosphate guanylyltransferase